MPGSCPTPGNNIDITTTSDGVVFTATPCDADKARTDLPTGLPDGLFQDTSGCMRALPAALGGCASDTVSGRITGTYEDSYSGVVGARTATATLTNCTAYNLCPLVLCQIGPWYGDALPGWNIEVGFDQGVGIGLTGRRLQIVPNTSITYPANGDVLSGDNRTRITLAYHALFGRNPDAAGMANWLAWIATNEPTGTPANDRALWTAIFTAGAAEADDVDYSLAPQQWLYAAPTLAPGDTYTASFQPWVTLGQNGAPIPFGSWVIEEGYSIHIFAVPDCGQLGGFTYPEDIA